MKPPSPTRPAPPSGLPPRRTTCVLAALAGGLSLAGFTAIWWGYPAAILAGGHGVISLPTAVLVVLLSVTVCLQQWGQAGPRAARGWARGLAALLLGLLALLGLRPAGLAAWLDRGAQALVSQAAQAAGLTGSQIAPVTAVVLALVAGLVLAATFPTLNTGRSRVAARLAALLLALTQVVTLLGWGAGLPLVFGATTVPMSPGGAIAILFLSVALALNFGLLGWLRHALFGEVEFSTQVIPVFERRKRNWVLLGLALLAAAAVGGGVLYLRSQLIESEQQVLSKLTTIAELKLSQIETWHRERLADARAIQGVGALRRPLPAPEAGLPAGLDHFLSNFQASYDYRHITLFDRAGRLRYATPAGAEAEAELTPENFADLGCTDRVLMTELRRSPAGAIVLDMFAPLFTAAGEFNGIVRLEVDARRELLPLVQRWTDPTSQTGEVFLLRREGMDLVALTELRHEADAPLRLRRPLTRNQLLAGRAILEEAPGLLHGRDYHGVPTLGVARQIRDRGWLLMVKIDRTEALAPVRAETARVLILLAMLGGLVGLGLSGIWRQKLTALQAGQQLAEAERQAALARLGLVMDHANDVILLFNHEGRIVEANARVQAYYGYTPEEMRRLHGRDLRDPALGDTMAADFALAQRPEGHLFETRHRRKDGTTFPVEVNARPVSVDNQQFVLSIIRDIAERQRLAAEAARREAQFRFIFERVPVGLSFRDETGRLKVNAEHERITGVPAADANRPGVFAAASHPEDYARQLAAAEKFDKGEADSFAIEKRYVHPDGHTTWVQFSSHWFGDPKSGHREALTTIVDITQHKRREIEIERANRLYQLVSQINQTLVRVESREQLLDDVCRVLRETGRYQSAWVAWHNPATRRFEPVALAGVDRAYAAALQLSSDPAVPEGQGPSSVAFRENRTVVVNDVASDPLTARWREEVRQHGVRALVALPIRREHAAVATLIVYAGEKDAFQYQDIGLLEEAAGDISFALDVLAGNEERRRAMIALRTQEQHLQTLLNSTPAMIYSLRAAGDHGVTYISPNVLAQLGHAPEDFVRDPGFWAAHLHPDDAAANAAAARDLGATTFITREYRFRHGDGSWRWLHDEMRLVRDAAGQPQEVVGYLLDITERRRAEDALQAREQIFASMIGQAVDAIALINAADGRFVEFNQSAHESLGYTREEFAELTLASIQADHSPETVRRNTEQIQLNGWATFENRHRHRDGSLREVRVSARAITVRGHDYLTAVWSDIGEQKRLQVELRQQQGQLRAIFDHSPVGISFTAGTRMLLANAAHDRLTGVPFTPEIDAQLFKRATHPDDLAKQLQDSAAFMRGETDQFSCEKRYVHPDGKTAWVRLSVRRFTDPATGEAQNITTLTDITELKRAKAAEEEQQRFLSSLIDNSGSLIYAKDREGRYLLVNKVWEKETGKSRVETIGRTDADLFPPATAARFRDADVAVMAAGQAQSLEESLPDGENGTRAFLSVKFPTYNRTGEVTGICGMSTEITQLKRLQGELAEKEARLRFIFEHAPVGIAFAMADGAAVLVNPEHERITGVSAADSTIPGAFARVSHPEDYARQLEAAEPFIKGEVESYTFEKRYLHPDGKTVWARLSSRWFIDPGTGGKHAVTTLSDITEQKVNEIALREREEILSAVLEQAVDSIVLYDLTTQRFTEFNAAAHLNLGYTKEEFARMSVRDIDVGLQPDKLAVVIASMTTAEGAVVETKHRRKDGEIRDVRVSARKVTIHGHDYLGAVMTDVTESRRLLESLRQSEKQHRSLFENMDLGIVYQDATGRITAANPAAARILGLSLDQMQGRTSMDPGWRAIHEDGSPFPGEEHPAMVALRTGQRVHDVLMGIQTDAQLVPRWLLVNSVPESRPGESRPFRVFTIFNDVTTRRTAEADLRKLSLALAQSPISVVITDLQGNIEYVNPRFEEVTGYAAAEVLGRNPRILKSGLTDPAVFTELWQTISAGQVWRGELINQRKDGTHFTELALITSVKDAAGRPQLFVALKEDITERKATETALRINEETLETTGRMAQIGGWRLDLVNRRLDWTRETKRIHGVPPDYVPDLSRALAFYAPEFQETVRRVVTACADRGEPYDVEVRILTADGGSRWVRIKGEATRADGRIVGIQGAIQDITERHEAEENIRKLSRIVAQAPLSIAITDLSGAIEYVNPQFTEVTGYNLDEVRGQNPRVLKSGVTAPSVYQEMWQTLTTGGTWRGELHNKKKNGELYTERAVIAPVTDDEGRTTHYVALKEDITERKRTEQALAEVQERYRIMAENSNDVIWLYDLRLQRFLYLSPSVEKLRGLKPEQMATETYEDTLTPESVRRSAQIMERSLQAFAAGDFSGRTQTHELEQVHVDGRIIPIEVSLTFLDFTDNQPGRILGVSRDITERRRASEALRRSEELYRLIADNTSDAIWLYDLDRGRFTYMSPAAVRLSGRIIEEMVGHDLDCILTTDSSEEARRSIAGRLAAYRAGDFSARTHTGIYDHRHRDGRIIRGEVVSTLLTDPTGRVGQILGVSRDVTEREKAAQELRESLQRLRKAEEIAHVGNWELDHATEAFTWSDEVFRIFEQDRTAFTPSFRAMLDLVHPDDRARLGRVFRQSVVQQGRYMASHRILLPDGRVKHLEQSGETIYDRQGQPVRSIGTVQDVTERKQVEFELHSLVRELRTYAAVARTLEDRAMDPRAQLTTVAGHVVGSLPADNHARAEIVVESIHVHAGSRGERVAERTVPITVNGRAAGHLTLCLTARPPAAGAHPGPAPKLPQSELLESVARALGLALGERESFTQMRRSEERFRAIFDQAEVGMFETELDGTITRANPFLGRLLGQDPAALLGRRWRGFTTTDAPVRGDDPPPETPALLFCRREDGSVFRGLLSGKLERTADGQGRGYICLLQDVTAQVEARETLERFNTALEAQVARRTAELDARNREVQALLQAVPDRVMRLRLDGTVLYYQAASHPAAAPGEQAASPPADLVAASLDLGRGLLAATGPGTAEVELTVEGRLAALELRAAPVGNEEFVVFVRDITDRKRLEAETVAMLEKERQVSEMKTRFISVTSHEFRTPMAAAMGSVELLANHLDRLPPAKRQELLDRVTASLRRMTGMLDDVLTLNRIESRRVARKLAALDLREVLVGIVEEVRIGNSAGHRFRLEAPDRIELVSDANLLHHIISNLLSNAVRYSPARSEVTVTVAIADGQVRIAVQDEGIGVPEADRARIFEPFERGSNVGQIKGTGLGLNIVKRMVDLLGGSIHLETPASGGSRFIVELPEKAPADPSA